MKSVVSTITYTCDSCSTTSHTLPSDWKSGKIIDASPLVAPKEFHLCDQCMDSSDNAVLVKVKGLIG